MGLAEGSSVKGESAVPGAKVKKERSPSVEILKEKKVPRKKRKDKKNNLPQKSRSKVKRKSRSSSSSTSRVSSRSRSRRPRHKRSGKKLKKYRKSQSQPRSSSPGVGRPSRPHLRQGRGERAPEARYRSISRSSPRDFSCYPTRARDPGPGDLL